MSTTPILNVYHPDDSTLARDVVTMGAMADSVETAMLNLPRKFANLTALSLWTPANGALAFVEDLGQTYQRVNSEWRPIRARNISGSAAGRVYLGTDDEALATGSTYLGMSPASETSLDTSLWHYFNGTRLFRMFKTGRMQFHGDVTIDGSLNHNTPNKILWEGAWFMNATQSASLSETVTSQNTGIVLAWSQYSNGVAGNFDWNYVFVPKSHVVTNSGTGVQNILMAGADIIRKYVYINNSSISGFASNSSAPNNRQVLRRVIGV